MAAAWARLGLTDPNRSAPLCSMATSWITSEAFGLFRRHRDSPNVRCRMADIVDRTTRARMMARIRSRDTRPEMALRQAIHSCGLRFRLHDRKLPGTPDLVFRRFNAVCFVHGCFWHRHAGCPYTTMPSTRERFWKAKFDSNTQRDRRNRRELLEAGWRVAIVWECALRKQAAMEIARQLELWLHGSAPVFDTSPPT